MEVSLLYSLFSLVFNVNLWDSKTSMQCSYQSLCSSAYFKMSKAAELLAWYNNDVSLKLSSNMLTIKSESRKINWFLLGKTYWITCSLIKNFENRRSRKSWKLPKKKPQDKNSLNFQNSFQFDKIFWSTKRSWIQIVFMNFIWGKLTGKKSSICINLCAYIMLVRMQMWRSSRLTVLHSFAFGFAAERPRN